MNLQASVIDPQQLQIFAAEVAPDSVVTYYDCCGLYSLVCSAFSLLYGALCIIRHPSLRFLIAHLHLSSVAFVFVFVMHRTL